MKTHPIDAYCKRHNIPLGMFALKVGVRLSSLRRIRTGERRPSTVLLDRIRDFTEGEVTANDILGARLLPIKHRYYTPEAKCNGEGAAAGHSGTDRCQNEAA